MLQLVSKLLSKFSVSNSFTQTKNDGNIQFNSCITDIPKKTGDGDSISVIPIDEILKTFCAS